MTKPTTTDMESYPHVIFTSDVTWNPDTIDDEYNVKDLDINEEDHIPSFGWKELNQYGEITDYESNIHKMNTNLHDFETYVDYTVYQVHFNKGDPKQHDFNRLKPNFGFVPANRIQKTIENTTQFCRMDAWLPLCKHFKSRFPAANVSC